MQASAGGDLARSYERNSDFKPEQPVIGYRDLPARPIQGDSIKSVRVPDAVELAAFFSAGSGSEASHIIFCIIIAGIAGKRCYVCSVMIDRIPFNTTPQPLPPTYKG